jgi:hypothetical protein
VKLEDPRTTPISDYSKTRARDAEDMVTALKACIGIGILIGILYQRQSMLTLSERKSCLSRKKKLYTAEDIYNVMKRERLLNKL